MQKMKPLDVNHVISIDEKCLRRIISVCQSVLRSDSALLNYWFYSSYEIKMPLFRNCYAGNNIKLLMHRGVCFSKA